MRLIDTASGLIRLSIKRLRSDVWLSIGLMIGLVVASMLTVSVPMYTEAANNRLLQQEMVSVDRTLRIPYMFRAINSSGDLGDAQISLADRVLTEQAPGLVGLPLEITGFTVQSDFFGLYAADDESAYASRRDDLGRFKLGAVRDFQDHVTLVEGRWPAEHDPAMGGALEVLVSETAAAEAGFQAGEDYVVFRGIEAAVAVDQIPVRVVGVWRSNDPSSTYWFLSTKVYDGVLLTSESSYRAFAAARPADQQIYFNYAAWYHLYDGSGLTADRVPRILRGTTILKTRLTSAVPSIGFPVSPESALTRHQLAVRLQTTLMLSFGLPIIILVLLFVAFVAGIASSRRRGELAVLRSRGYGTVHLLMITGVGTLVLVAISIAVGLLLGPYVAQLMWSTRSFLEFTGREPLAVRIVPSAVRVGALVGLLAAVVSVLPDLASAGLTTVAHWQSSARETAKPWWQRYYLDVLLAIMAAYGYYMIVNGDAMSFLLGGGGNLFENPLVLVTPFAFMLAAVLIFLRLVPLLFKVSSIGTGWLPSLVPFLASRRLERASGRYSGVLMLLVLSIGLSLFTASMAWTLDRNLRERTYFEVGADVSVSERGVVLGTEAGLQASGGLGGETTTESESVDSLLVAGALVPVAEALDVAGIREAARLYRGSVSVRTGSAARKGTIVGVERLQLPNVAFFRSDFGPQPLGALMNALAVRSDGVLVDPSFLAESGLAVGDTVSLQLDVSQGRSMNFRIVGTVAMFPTVYREDYPLFVANLNYVTEQLGWPLTGHIWLSVASDADAETIAEGLTAEGFDIREVYDARAMISGEQSQLVRVGLFGFLSAGFVATSLLSMLSLLIYSLTSFKERYIQYGILSALGLTKGQIASEFLSEQMGILGLGIAAGTGLGAWACALFLPFFQVSTGDAAPMPPMIVEIALRDIWKTYAVIGVSLVVLILGTARLLRSLRMFEAIKLGSQLTG
mgnify:FL=1